MMEESLVRYLDIENKKEIGASLLSIDNNDLKCLKESELMEIAGKDNKLRKIIVNKSLGLKDKNGEVVFDGDILVIKDEVEVDSFTSELSDIHEILNRFKLMLIDGEVDVSFMVDGSAVEKMYLEGEYNLGDLVKDGAVLGNWYLDNKLMDIGCIK